MDARLSQPSVEWILANLPRVDGRHFAVTGATGSLGQCVCEALTLLGARLTLLSRDMVKGEALRSRLLSLRAGAEITVREIDMGSFASVERLAGALLTAGEPIDCLIHNAGVFSKAGRRTADGCELHLQTNALSPLRLTDALMPLLRASDAPRVVTVTSLAVKFAQPGICRTSTQAYAQSKLLLTLSMTALSRKYPEIAFRFAHPGVSATGLFRPGVHPTAYNAAFLRAALPMMERLFMRPDQACLSIVYAACRESMQKPLARPRGLFGVWGRPSEGWLWKNVERNDERR